MKPLSPIISANELLNLKASEDFILIDASDRANYDKKHLKGAQYVDLNSELSNITDNPSDGGRHPLPNMENFLETISNLGISPKKHVVVYDRKAGANAAARFWWMLVAIGHPMVQVLDGGFKAAENAGFPVDADKVQMKKSEVYKTTDWQLNWVNLQQVRDISLNTKNKIIDVRSPERYQGKSEPIDLIAGHIPNAINIPYDSNLDQKGLFLEREKLRELYHQALGETPGDNTIVYCGSGVTACHSILAMTYAGFETPKLYVGSWSEWSRNKDNPIATTKD